MLLSLFSDELRNQIIEQHSVESIILIIQEFDDVSKYYAANLLRLLCDNPEIREQVDFFHHYFLEGKCLEPKITCGTKNITKFNFLHVFHFYGPKSVSYNVLKSYLIP